jgi:hypothetical protein
VLEFQGTWLGFVESSRREERAVKGVYMDMERGGVFAGQGDASS